MKKDSEAPAGPPRAEQGGPDGSEQPDIPRPTDEPIKFLINISIKVVPQGEPPSCQSLLDLLMTTGFSTEDQKHIKDVAVVFGLNGKDSDEVKKKLKRLMKETVNSDIKFKKMTFTWKPKKKHKVPFRAIRETLKNSDKTRDLVKILRLDGPCHVYFSFVDADTVSFNEVYSSYIETVRSHCNTTGHPPTLMSTGYEFQQKEHGHDASRIDRQCRIRTAQHFPLGTYYPEPNFCVLLPRDEPTLPESFESEEIAQHMESPALIRNVKCRTNFTALFFNGNPIIITIPERFVISRDGLTCTQSHFNPFVWATSAYIHKEIQLTTKKRGGYGIYRGKCIRLITSDGALSEANLSDLPIRGQTQNFNNAIRAFKLYRDGWVRQGSQVEE